MKQYDEKIPDNKNEKHPYVGVVFEVGGIKYYAPFSSPKPKHKNMKRIAGRIRNLRRQVRFELIPKQEKLYGGYENPVYYIADFTYTVTVADRMWVEVEEVNGCKKGSAYREFVMKRKLMIEKYKIEVREI